MTDEEILEVARAADQLGVALGAVFDDVTVALHMASGRHHARQLVALADNGEHLVLCDAPSGKLLSDVRALPNAHRNAVRHETGKLVREGISRDLGVSMHRHALVQRPPDPFTRDRLAEALAELLPQHVVGVDVHEGPGQTIKATITVQDPTPAEYIEIKFETADDEAGRALAAELAADYGDEVD